MNEIIFIFAVFAWIVAVLAVAFVISAICGLIHIAIKEMKK